MDTFENNPQNEDIEAIPMAEESPQEPASLEPEAPQPTYRGAGAGRKESPYADSPYVAYQRPQYEGRYQYQPQPEPAKKKPKAKKQSRFPWKKACAIALALALLIGSNAVTAALVSSRWDKALYETEKQFDQQIQDLQKQIDSAASASSALVGSSVAAGEALTPAQVYAKNVNSVVAVSAIIQQSGYYGQTTTGESTGSGFILTENGYVVTNCHVVEGATSVSIVTHDGTEYPANVVGYDDNNDVAVLKVEAEGLSPVTLGSSSELIIGDMVVAIGNPLGELTSTQTVGYVSGIGREVATDSLTTISMIQTDAAINSGNSGGPLFNMAGEVVGITTAKYSGTTTSGASIEGIGFAIPIDDVMGMISDLMDYGYVTGAYLGVSVQNVDESAASMYNIPSGAYVYSVVEGSCADIAGVRAKDIITDLGGHTVTNVTTLTRALRNFKAGDTTTITVVRGGQQLALTITLDEKPREMTTPSQEEADVPSSGSSQEQMPDIFDFFFGG